jgi:putative dehydrogenase
MVPVISIIGAGAMGCAVARRLVAHGCKILTNLDGRTAATRERARAAGMTDVPLGRLAEADMILSIVPPAVAASVARSVADVAKASASKPLYVDCNAVSPRTVTGIAAIIASTGYPFVDAGIIGQPPSGDGSRTVFYAAGPAARELAKLNDCGLLVEVLQGPVGAASALKMSFAGMTKGVTAICTAMMLAATRAGAAQALRQELIASRPELLAWADMQVPKMFPKAYRWVGEMEEIAEFSEDPATGQMYLGIAGLYQRIAADLDGARGDEHSLLEFVRGPA